MSGKRKTTGKIKIPRPNALKAKMSLAHIFVDRKKQESKRKCRGKHYE